MKKAFYLMTALLLILAFGLTACGGSSSGSASQESSSGSEASQSQTASKGDAAKGKELFSTTCSACHGPDGGGVQGLGKDMTTSEFIASKTDDELVEFVKVGRDPSDPLNTTGVAMPPKGGNPTFSDEDLYDIVAHIRTLQE